MGSLNEHNISLWVGTTPETDYPRLDGDIHVDVAIIGAGITGLSVASQLKRAGATVAVLEAGRVAAGATGYTTAKVTSQHGLMYHDLIKRAGEELAGQYAAANEAAISEIASQVNERGIHCDFRRGDAHVYTTEIDRLDRIQNEVDAARSLGIAASFQRDTELPYHVEGAVRFSNQAMFHPRKYALGLAELIPGNGSHIFEKTRVNDVRCEGTCTVYTDAGAIHAGHVVMATQIPFLDRGGYFARTSPARSYAMAAKLNGPVLNDMYINIDLPTRSLRPHDEDGESYLLIGGEGHKVGQDADTRERYQSLEYWAREHFDVQSVDYRWSAQDYMAVDHVPYIGPITPNNERILIATGFNKWGFTTGVAAGMILTDTIMGRTSPWSDVFDSTRADIRRSAKEFVTENANVAKRFVGDRLRTLKIPDVSELGKDEGGIVEADGEKVAAYRDITGELHSVSPVCTHLGCQVTWNTAERSWDCPCHGSRFDVDGGVLQGPGIKPLSCKDQTDG